MKIPDPRQGVDLRSTPAACDEEYRRLHPHELCDDCAEALTILFAAQLDVRADVECPDWVLCVALGMAE